MKVCAGVDNKTHRVDLVLANNHVNTRCGKTWLKTNNIGNFPDLYDFTEIGLEVCLDCDIVDPFGYGDETPTAKSLKNIKLIKARYGD